MTIKQTKTEERLKRVLQGEISRAEGEYGDELEGNRVAALKAYYGGEPAQTEKSEDTIFDTTTNDVADMTIAVLAQLTPMLATDALVMFEPKGQQDEEAARAESSAVDTLITEQNQGTIEIQEAVKDALLLRNGCLKVWTDEQQDIRDIPLTIGEDDEPLSNAAIAALLQPRAPNETRELKPGKVRVTTTKRQFRMSAVPIDNILWEANADSSDLQSFRFFAERLFYTRSELVEMGFPKPKVDELPYYTDDDQRVSRNRNATSAPSHLADSRDQQTIECYESYLLIDLDGDGVSERYRILYAGGYVLEYEPVPLIPYAVGTAFITPHRLTGESLFDRLRETQRVKTYFLRQWMTNAAHVSTGGKKVVDPTRVKMEDLVDPSTPVVRTRGEAVVQQIVTPDIGPSMVAALEYQDKIRSERGGAALDMMAAELQLAGETAFGIDRQIGQKELLVSYMASNLGETLIRPIYLIMHTYLRLYANEPLSLKMGGQWIQVDPRQWQPRERCQVKAGKSAGERAHIQRTLQSLVQLQISAMQQGMDGVFVDKSNVYNAVMDWATYAGLDNPDSYLVNPMSPQAQQAMQQKAQQAQQQAQAQQTMFQQQQQLVQQQLQLEREKLMLEAKKNNDEIAYKYWSDRLTADTKEAEIVAKGTIDLEKTQLEGEQREAQALRANQNGDARTNGVAQ